MLIRRSLDPTWLSNSWLVADRVGGQAVLIDSGGPVEPIQAALADWRVELTHLLCTHHHLDHIAHNADYRRQHDCAVCGHRREAELIGELDHILADDQELVSGELHVRALHIPGHTSGQLAFLINEERVFTGDTLFRGSVGGTRAADHTTYEDLAHSVMDRLMSLPHHVVVHPGHTDSSTIGQEWRDNPFVRLWRGLDSTQHQACTAFGRPATLLLRARDYDGGSKCLVRFDDDGVTDIVPGSKVRTP